MYSTVPPATVCMSPSVLSTYRSGAAVTGVSSVSVLSPGVKSSPLVPSSAIAAVLAITSTPLGSGLSTTSLICTVPLAPAAKSKASVSYCMPLTNVHEPVGDRLSG